jgi:predicted transcriptional regulator
MKNRSRMDIAAAILEAAQGGQVKTRIMYKALIPSEQFKQYLELLVDCGLLKKEAKRGGEEKRKRKHSKRGNVYTTTRKGLRFLKLYREIDSMIPEGNMLTKFNQFLPLKGEERDG